MLQLTLTAPWLTAVGAFLVGVASLIWAVRRKP